MRARAAIPVARINGPILLVSGGADGSWPASKMARAMVAQMAAAGRAKHVQHLEYPEAGHLLFWGYLPVVGADRNQGQIFGGTAAGTAAARADSWPEIRAFLDAALRP